MQKDKLIERISAETKTSKEKTSLVLNALFVSRAIPSIIQDKVMANIADDAGTTVDEARRVVNSVFGFMAEQPRLFEVMSEQLVGSWINDCDGCNGCGEATRIASARIAEIKQ